MRSRPAGERAAQIAGYYTKGQLRNLFRHITSYDAGRQIHERQLAVYNGKRLGELFATMTLQNRRASEFRLADILEQQDEDAIAKHSAGRSDYLLHTGVPTNPAYKIVKDDGSFSKKPKPTKVQALVKTRERTAVAPISKGKMSAEEKLEKRQELRSGEGARDLEKGDKPCDICTVVLTHDILTARMPGAVAKEGYRIVWHNASLDAIKPRHLGFDYANNAGWLCHGCNLLKSRRPLAWAKEQIQQVALALMIVDQDGFMATPPPPRRTPLSEKELKAIRGQADVIIHHMETAIELEPWKRGDIDRQWVEEELAKREDVYLR
ncbi:hypothetical protein BDZ90DRAFT_159705 [Jaminaea rosea]|uniref:Uncharacterized protein n=1 Tax=Jaminaea rosea TaxID=1569628 RepID=A0A316URQ5_9BASI|nr:hypothetical protein BDZ90DRAFT_159705 [Jaminaea rosea]PWN28000.1 hypothetical protein BDZ90DRAFT_159705 [Jaminaea rosea]